MIISVVSAMASAVDKVTSERFSLYYIPTRTTSSVDSYVTENDPPIVKSVSVTPAEPGPNDPVIIIAVITNNPAYTTSKTLLAQIWYSKDDGATWTQKEMDQSDLSTDSWSVELPPLGVSGKVRYYFTAKDDSGNYLVELPNLPVEWGGVEAPKLSGNITDDDDDPRIVQSDLDILSVRMGYDGSMLYFSIRLDGDVSGGTVSPFNVNVYSAGIYYPDEIVPGRIRTDFVLEHSQHAQFLRFPVVGLLDTKEGLIEVRQADARYYSDDNWLYMRFKKDALKNKEFKSLRIIFGTGLATSHDPLIIVPEDTTGFVNIVSADRYFVVK